MFVEGLSSLLAADSGVQAVLGTIVSRADAATGIWPDIAPDNPLYPYVVYSEIHSEAVISFQGTNPTTEYRFQFACYAASFKLAKQVSNAIKNVLDGFTGALNDPDNVVLQQSIRISEHDEVERELKATTYAFILDYHFIVNSPK